MNGMRLLDRLCAALLLGAGLLFLYMVLSGSAAPTSPDGFPVAAFFVAAGLVSLIGGWCFWTCRWPGAGEDYRVRVGRSRFGRDADAPPQPTTPGAARLLLILPLVALLLIADDLFPGSSVPAQSETADFGLPEIPDALRTPPEISQPVPSDTTRVAGDPVSPISSTPVLPRLPDTLQAPSELPRSAEPVPQPEVRDVALAIEPPEATRPPAVTAPLPSTAPIPVQADGHRDAVVWLDMSADGRHFLSASTDHTIKLWNTASGGLVRMLAVHRDMARTALFLPGGEQALSAGDDGEILLLSVADGQKLHVFDGGKNGGVNKLAISQDGTRAVSGHEAGTVVAWDLGARRVLHVFSGNGWPISGVAVSPDGRRAAAGSIDGTLNLWDLDNGRLLRTWHGHERGTYGAVFTGDGKRLITGSGDLTIKIWDLQGGKEVLRLEGIREPFTRWRCRRTVAIF